jgi:hypothetical protein
MCEAAILKTITTNYAPRFWTLSPVHMKPIYLYNKQVLVGDHLLRESGLYGIIFMNVCVYYFIFSRHS